MNYKDTPMNNTSIGFGGKLIKHDLYLEKGSGILDGCWDTSKKYSRLDRFGCDVEELGIILQE